MNFAAYAVGSVALAAVVVAGALARFPDVFSAIMSLSDSVVSFGVFANLLFVVMYAIGSSIVFVFLGTIREHELEKIYQNGWYIFLDVVLLMGMHEIWSMVEFFITCCHLGCLFVFHWLAQDRVQSLYHTLHLPSRLTQLRVTSFALLLFAYDVWLCVSAFRSYVAGNREAFGTALFLFELLELSFSTCMKLAINYYEANRYAHEDSEEWELKPSLLYVLDCFVDTFGIGVIVVFSQFYRNFSLPIIHGIITRSYNVVTRTRDFYKARKAQSELEQLVTPASAADVARDNICVICREEMDVNSESRPLAPRKLVCGHVIHFGCLKSWLGRSQLCPTCRHSVNAPLAAPRMTTTVAVPNLGSQDESLRLPTPTPAPAPDRDESEHSDTLPTVAAPANQQPALMPYVVLSDQAAPSPADHHEIDQWLQMETREYDGRRQLRWKDKWLAYKIS